VISQEVGSGVVQQHGLRRSQCGGGLERAELSHPGLLRTVSKFQGHGNIECPATYNDSAYTFLITVSEKWERAN